MKIKLYHPGIIHISFQSQYEVTSAFMRVQEYYESDIPSIKGKYFTLEQYMDAYAERMGNFTYTSDWAGFNVPSNIFNQFIKLFKKDFLEKEKALVDAVLSAAPKKGKYYVIGTFEDTDHHTVLDHEIRHTLYHIDDEYKKEISARLKKVPAVFKTHVGKILLSKGYDKSVITDEQQAYLCTSSMSELIDKFGAEGEQMPWNEIADMQQYSSKYVSDNVKVNEDDSF